MLALVYLMSASCIVGGYLRIALSGIFAQESRVHDHYKPVKFKAISCEVAFAVISLFFQLFCLPHIHNEGKRSTPVTRSVMDAEINRGEHRRDSVPVHSFKRVYFWSLC